MRVWFGITNFVVSEWQIFYLLNSGEFSCWLETKEFVLYCIKSVNTIWQQICVCVCVWGSLWRLVLQTKLLPSGSHYRVPTKYWERYLNRYKTSFIPLSVNPLNSGYWGGGKWRHLSVVCVFYCIIILCILVCGSPYVQDKFPKRQIK